jgi:Chlorophyll A-B binding protein
MQTQPNEYYQKQSDRKYGDVATKFEFGTNPSAEIWNGRLAMIGFIGALLVELFTGQGVFHWLGLM